MEQTRRNKRESKNTRRDQYKQPIGSSKRKKELKVQKTLSWTTELTENDAPHICNYICVIETTRVFSPNSNLLKVDIKMITSKTSDI